MNEPIELRAHHLQCIPRFYKGGYSTEFALHMKAICKHIRANPSTKIKILVGEMDTLCHICPHKSGNECTQSKRIGKWVATQDSKIVEFLGIKHSSIHEARDIFNLSLEKTNEETIKEVCAGCKYLGNCMRVGVNKAFVKELNKN